MKQNLLKTMLVSTALLAGSMGGVMAGTVTTTYDFEDANKVFAEDSRVTVAIEDDADLSSKVVTFTGAKNAQNGYCFAHYDFSDLVKKATKVKISFDYWNTNGGRSIVSLGDAETRGTTGGSSKMTYSPTGALFRIGSDKTTFYINDKKYTLADYCDKWLKVEVTVDLTTNKVSYILKDNQGNQLLAENDVDYYNSAKSCSQIDVFGCINNSKMAKIDNLSIAADIDTEATYYTATFNEATGLTPEVKVYSDEACTIEVSSSSLKGNTKYYYVASLPGYEDCKGEIAVGSANADVSFTMAKKARFTYAVNLIDESGKVLNTVYSNDDAYDGLVVNYSYPKYLTDENGKVTHVCELTSYSGNVVAAKDATTSVKYKVYSGTAYFVEGEKAISAANVESANYSSGTAVRGFDADKDLFTIPESGIYRLSYAVCSNNVNTVRQFIVSTNDDAIITKDINWSVNDVLSKGTITEEAKSFEEGTVIKAKGSDTNIILDYILLEKLTGDNVAVTSVNYATYVPTCNVVAPADVKVYTAKADVANKVVNLTEITAGSVIPAGTPVLVGAAAGTYTFAASADEPTTIGENELKAATTETKGNGSIYVLVEQNNQAVFAPVKEGVEVPVGKAYMVINAANKAAFYSIGGGNSTTGINNVDAKTTDNGAYYTLQGVKVNKPTAKGIYIHNGKKMIK